MVCKCAFDKAVPQSSMLVEGVGLGGEGCLPQASHSNAQPLSGNAGFLSRGEATQRLHSRVSHWHQCNATMTITDNACVLPYKCAGTL